MPFVKPSGRSGGALVWASWWQPPSEAVTTLAGAVQTLTGYAGGVGYAGLVAIRVQAQDRCSTHWRPAGNDR